jgi:UDP:flavonoid glycosyltransferase YjiC (YdhE family)
MPAQRPHVVFVSIPATGHFNPTLPFVAELSRIGCEVTYYIVESLRDTVESAGATWRAVPDTFSPELGVAAVAKHVANSTGYNGFVTQLAVAELILPGLLEDVQRLERKPSVIIYDPHHCPWGKVLAHVLGVPSIGFITVPGPGTITITKEQVAAWEADVAVQGPRKAIQNKYGIDLLKHGRILEHYSPTLNIVTTIEDLYTPPLDEMQVERFGHFPFTCVGALIDMKVKRCANAASTSAPEALPMARIQSELDAGKRLLYVSLGTVANSRFWDKKFGGVATENGLAEVTGKEITLHIFRTCFQAFGGSDQVLVIMALGPQEDALEGLPAAPENFILRTSVPQLQVLSLCHAFVTHGGANSVHEAFSFGVPLAVVPIFGDQPKNAVSVAATGAGVSFRDPLQSLTVPALRDAVTQMLGAGDSNTYRAAARGMQKMLANAGGVKKAGQTVLDLVADLSARRGGA